MENFQRISHKNILIFPTKDYFKNPQYRVLEEPMLFLLTIKQNLSEKPFPVLNQKLSQILQ